MATAAAGGAGQEKQLAPTLLSFFIYNPKLGPKEGEVLEAGVAHRDCGERRVPSRPGSVLASVAAEAPTAAVMAMPSLSEAWAAACTRGINASPRGTSPNKGGLWARSGAALGRRELRPAVPYPARGRLTGT